MHPSLGAVQSRHERALKLRGLATPELANEGSDFAAELLHLSCDLGRIVEARLTDEVRDDQRVLLELLHDHFVRAQTVVRELGRAVRNGLALMHTRESLSHIEEQGHRSGTRVVTHVGQ